MFNNFCTFIGITDKCDESCESSNEELRKEKTVICFATITSIVFTIRSVYAETHASLCIHRAESTWWLNKLGYPKAGGRANCELTTGNLR